MAALVLGLDIGTTATKGVLLDPKAGNVGEAEEATTLYSPHLGWAEEDPEEWWRNVAVVTRACLNASGARPGDIAAVGVSGMVPTLILLDRAGKVLRPSIQQNDARSHQEIKVFQGRVSEAEALEKSGSAITQQSIGPKLLWLRRHEPETMAQAAHLLGSYDFIVYRLTGGSSCERNWALESGLFDFRREAWDSTILDLSTIDSQLLGPVRWASEVVGEVSSEAARHAGLRPGTPVVAGTADHIASAFSAGLKAPGDLLVKLGGSGDILYSLDDPVLDSRLYLDYHVIPGKFILNGCMAASGSIIKWFRQHFAGAADYATLDALASSVAPGAEGLVLLPYFLGEKSPIHDPLARGVLFGLTLTHTTAHAYRAILEGIAYGFRHHLAVLSERGLTTTRARVTNGGAHSRLWKQVTADVLGLPLEEIARHPGSSLGAAFVAGKGVGLFQAWQDIERFIRIAEVVEPDPRLHDRYRELFTIYRGLYDSLKGHFVALHRAIGNAP
ncbi:MAG TPA: FGGY-family carbohydrate kinase [Candidatus Acidoferrum sp.]|nr:FGGY-family carbohydrate kinase [Candidatus Acidoferrum sp.]